MNLSIKRITPAFIKENLSLILLIPTVIGGIWQLVELGTIGVAYIRFFSASQIIADGLLVLFICIGSILLSQGILPQKDDDTKDKDGTEEINVNKNLDNSWWWYIVTVLIVCSVIFFFAYQPTVSAILQDQKAPGIAFVSTIVMSILLITLLGTAIDVLLRIRGSRNKIFKLWNRPIGHFLFSVLLAVLGVFSIIAIAISMRIFHNSFMLPDNFENLKYLTCKVKKNNPKMKSFKIIYFNDKYIFINQEDSSANSQIEVFNFEAFMEENACK